MEGQSNTVEGPGKGSLAADVKIHQPNRIELRVYLYVDSPSTGQQEMACWPGVDVWQQQQHLTGNRLPLRVVDRRQLEGCPMQSLLLLLHNWILELKFFLSTPAVCLP